ncbi:MAG: VWA domain-containing protein [Deltaproteobacteria bacterium]|nr:VWA domain-containing protein [Deltaproteobacteria bacterium]MBW2412941.1 VWA domain-containing protein [Deltaproteobacteria bacterium]
MTESVVAAGLAVALVMLRGAWRSHLELRHWLGRDRFGRRRALRALALGCASALLITAFLRAAHEPPRLGGAGIDVVIVLDVSRSMGAADVAPSRLRRAVRSAERLALEATSVRLGLVLFAGDAFAALPLTQDRDAVLTYLRALDTEMISQRGSDLARALRVALQVFDPRSDRPRRIVLLSDGEHAGGSLEEAAASLGANGVRVTSIGFGEEHGAPVPGPGGRPLQDERGDEAYSRRSDASFELLAATTGGPFFVEHRDRPPTAALLPPPSAAEQHHEPRSTGPLRALMLGAGILLALELAASLRPAARGSRARLGLRPAPAVALVALTLLGVQGAGWLSQGDRTLARGDARGALSLYRRTERNYGAVPESRLRIGNALYRLDERGRAAAAYLDALRALPLEERDQRFAANFNLGDALLGEERWAEARDAFWTAILDRPDSVEAKFNYEWAAERAGPEDLPPDLPMPPQDAPDTRSGEGDGEGETVMSEAVPSPRDGSQQAELSPEEAERWLDSLEERVEAPLRKQIAEQFEPGRPQPPGGQAW